ncbi:hypothetical protein L4D00_12825 [Photobacterium swingsii]|uniref:Uncharacterized protein n=1 Tax=Photobacterium swingsii TaxID=680026 RepID=A0A0J8VD62_9GAMM|nr:hypothetical protein [Photobacterium swingsii]KMV31428.1 hypothetical protein AB733_04675 [Photobacterium swingsii]PSW25060.1 hypothetical protein C9I94_09660 [Photobacterium swingsii]
MNKQLTSGILGGLIPVLGLILLLAGGSHFPVIEWPFEAYQGLVFSLVWGLGISQYLAYFISAMLFITLFAVGYAVGCKLYRQLRH